MPVDASSSSGTASRPVDEAERSIDAGGVRWHVWTLGRGPALLLLHGTGASSRSFRDLAPLLAQYFTVVAPDLPGHARSSLPSRPSRLSSNSGMSVDGMARSMHALLDALGTTPSIAVGHSAGAAVLVRMALDQRLKPRALVGLNAALLPLDGVMRVMSPMAKLLAMAPGVSSLVSGFGRDARSVARLVDSTGSKLDAAGTRLYAELIGDRDHVAGAIAMMAAWNLDRTDAQMPSLRPAPLLIVGSNDRTVPPQQAARVASRVPGSQMIVMTGLGHLAHEEAPDEAARLIVAHARERGVFD